MQKERVWFGKEQVSANEKQHGIQSLFTDISEKYDLMNDLMSFGTHRISRRVFLEKCKLKPGYDMLDLAGGTGDIARLAYGKCNSITVADFSLSMLESGRNKFLNLGRVNNLEWVCADATQLPFADEQFDIVTMGWGLRNVAQRPSAYAEILRVLKTEGRFVVIEMCPDTNKNIKPLYDFHMQTIVPFFGKLLAKNEDAYSYLADSIQTFPSRIELEKEFKTAGFEAVGSTSLAAGVLAIHWGCKV